MLNTPLPTEKSNRRSFLSLAIAAAAIVPLSDSAIAHTEVSAAAQKNARNQKTIQTAESLRELWLGHIFWVRNVSIAAIDRNDLAAKVADSRRLRTRKRSPRQIEPFYGAPAKKVFSSGSRAIMAR